MVVVANRMCQSMADPRLGEELTWRQRRFADAIADGVLQDQAYREAGYTAANDFVARVCAVRLLKAANINNYIAKKLDQICSMRELTLARRLVECARLADDET